MKIVTMVALFAAQLLNAAPAAAAELTESRGQEMGAFGGVRVRVPLDGRAGQRQLRAGLAVAPTLQIRSANGEIRTRIGEGLELGYQGDDRLRLSLAGTPVSRLAQGPAGPDGRRARVSTLGWVAIGVGGVLVAAAGLWALCASGTICNLDDE